MGKTPYFYPPRILVLILLTWPDVTIILGSRQGTMPKNKQFVIALIDRDVRQTEVARKAGIHMSTLSLIVNGHLEPSEHQKKAIAKVLRLQVHELFPEPESVVR